MVEFLVRFLAGFEFVGSKGFGSYFNHGSQLQECLPVGCLPPLFASSVC